MKVYALTVLAVCGLCLVLFMTAKALDHLVSVAGAQAAEQGDYAP